MERMEVRNEIKYASIVPLIGGMIFGMKQIINHDPEVIFSYSPFASNDRILRDYMPNVPYIELDKGGSLPQQSYNLDIVGALCPCSGLSQLNSAASRGANAPQNDWMYFTAEFVMENIKPKVFWGENAPALYGSVGLPVANRLRSIGEKNGYSMTLLRTDSTKHGVPQKRVRTFYFFWKDSTCPILNWHDVQAPTLTEFFKKMPFDWLDKDEVKQKTDALLNDPLYQWLKKIHGDEWRNHVKEVGKSLMDVVLMSGRAEEYLEFVQNGDFTAEAYNRAKHAKYKREIGKNYWDFSPFIPGDATGALTGARMNAIHPFEDRFLTYRELAHLMGLPGDMKLPIDAPGKIFQNVPSWTASDWTFEVVKFLRGELQDSGRKFLKQDNIQQKIEEETSMKELVALF